jgi:RND family efflux transporter MFP subunit
VIAAGALACSALAACSGGRSAQAGLQVPATLVQLATVNPVPIEDASEYVAAIQSLSSTGLKPEVSGEVTRIFVKSGDRVTPGARLFLIDPLRQEASVSSQEADRAAQEAATTFAQQQLERARTLKAAGAISEQELEQAQANADAAEAQLASLRARLQQERVTLKYYEVRAPAPGIVGDIPVRVGTHVTSDTVLTTIDQNVALEVYVEVPLERSPDLRTGLPLEVLDPQGAVLARTTVSFISPRVDDQTQSILVKGRLEGTGQLRTAQYVRARLIWKTADGLAIPVLSVIRVNGQPFVFVAEERNGQVVASQRLINLGRIIGNNVVVSGGLAAGERIVVSGVQKLANGVPIRTS